ncbi:biopolymer transport protein ExbB [Sinobacterium caligoides]|uniref:Biopolymer transport protein ExbB n=1 Tax=Sinobacterium caligoides TaxID=933926 RepID=A0A3N2DLR1_9GAMM|nr:MotA/TolQ/ExbB proton channel family protein [Sinobacterium caligoides]ROS00285.1 biopolymer transport protein ExbB [Sinobacterium caligoides]
MLEIIQAGGWIMLPIVLCSVLALAISVERLWALKADKIAPRNQLAEVWQRVKDNSIDADYLKQLKGSSPLGALLASGLSNSRYGRDIMKESIEESASHIIHDMERNMNALGTIAAIAPLLGLLGTVVGMIDVFTQIVDQGTGNAGALAGGISQALITTAAGLAVAIPALVMHRYLHRRIDTMVVSLEQESVKLVDALHSERQVAVKEKKRK